ncbi:Serine phosphatase RsbU, regulator of sigma subunit [Variovorax sp. HW608]|uniref:SpoIIE family protein phosphatase n=1 Tax=Variovorax sp. HW608 TaxID=1034889 RepID=UPI00081FE5F3|nr:SpoIIE family protein phosphatase [Variovorax sp. HW608]SCK12239.1 Serine phosphatase RsbU, regulator of sigma subunit [Variovorax sp. HW608]
MNPDAAPPAALVVDDEPVTRLMVKRALENLGCTPVLEATDGIAAQKILREHPEVALVLTDIMMPRMDGLELLRWGREAVPDAMWIVLSGLETFDSAVTAIRLGAFDFLPKSPHSEEMGVAVRNALERRQLLAERERLHRALQRKVRQLEETSEVLRRDLERAEVIQRALLPRSPPPMEGYCIQAVYRPGQHVGGDLYDVVRLGERHLAFYLADATGHGVTSAMLSVLFKQRLVLVDPATGLALPPAEVLAAVNRSICEAHAAPGLFLTAVFGLLDTSDSSLTLASAGHPPVLHTRDGRETRLVRRTGPALGLTQDAHFGQERLQLLAGDRILLYTDGLLPSGSERELELLRQVLARPLASAQEVMADLHREAPAGADRDDVTLLLIDAHAGASWFDNGAETTAIHTHGALRPEDEVVFYGETDHAAYLALRGRATWMHCDAFHEAALTVLDGGRPLVLDLSGCEYMDSTCLGTVHELVARSGVSLAGVGPGVRGLFEELSMQQVLAAIREDLPAAPELHALGAGSDQAATQKRILQAHEALSSLSERNREEFKDVVDSLRGEQDGPG